MAVLAEQAEIDLSSEILGVIWDGTGWGTDGNIWGGEFFLLQNQTVKRVAHWDYFTHFMGDKMAREPRLSAFSLSGGNERLKGKFSSSEWDFYRKALQKSPLQTSSIGRVFDAVASALGLCDQQSYEGQAALLLEQEATAFLQERSFVYADYYPVFGEKGLLNTRSLIAQVMEDTHRLPAGEIAARFHLSL
ncbi:MAG: carbamoyltransferase HypF, partial [Leadbetterella sp.]|nr:carbamoyltransferase HypF [Leadbetterella sp.]